VTGCNASHTRGLSLNFGLFSHLQCIIDLKGRNAVHGSWLRRNPVIPVRWEEFREAGITTPDQTRQIIGDLVVAQNEARFRPGCTDIKQCILPGTFARYLLSVFGMAGALAGMQIMAGDHDCSYDCLNGPDG